MAGIYIHIPFCKQACTYCDFHFSTQQTLRKPLIDALCKEIDDRLSKSATAFKTLYFGGGSPSILKADELQLLFDVLNKHLDVSELKEVTLESNPDDHTSEKLELWRSLGIDRLSIGIQSFIDRDLKFMNRAHNAEEARHCVARARAAGFEALTIDLIYGIPGQSHTEWQSNVQKAIQLEVDHISAYCLTVEERTALHHQVEKGHVEEVSDEEIEKQYLFLHRKLEDCGFEHYEISNFAKAGKRAQHNRSYWKGTPYIGIGPAAHSFDGQQTRRWNIANNPLYIKALANNTPYWESETLTETERTNEILITGLRTRKGVDLNQLPESHRNSIQAQTENYQAKHPGLLVLEEGLLRMNPEAWLLTDQVLKEVVF